MVCGGGGLDGASVVGIVTGFRGASGSGPTSFDGAAPIIEATIVP